MLSIFRSIFANHKSCPIGLTGISNAADGGHKPVSMQSDDHNMKAR